MHTCSASESASLRLETAASAQSSSQLQHSFSRPGTATTSLSDADGAELSDLAMSALLPGGLPGGPPLQPQQLQQQEHLARQRAIQQQQQMMQQARNAQAHAHAQQQQQQQSQSQHSSAMAGSRSTPQSPMHRPGQNGRSGRSSVPLGDVGVPNGRPLYPVNSYGGGPGYGSGPDVGLSAQRLGNHGGSAGFPASQDWANGGRQAPQWQLSQGLGQGVNSAQQQRVQVLPNGMASAVGMNVMARDFSSQRQQQQQLQQGGDISGRMPFHGQGIGSENALGAFPKLQHRIAVASYFLGATVERIVAIRFRDLREL